MKRKLLRKKEKMTLKRKKNVKKTVMTMNIMKQMK